MSVSDTGSDVDAVFNRMAWLCSRREYCSADVMRKIRQKGLCAEDASVVMQRLAKERYVDDARYARSFVRDKAVLSGWGPRKIAFALSAKGMPKKMIEEAMREISPEDSTARMREVFLFRFIASPENVPARFLAGTGKDYLREFLLL